MMQASAYAKSVMMKGKYDIQSTVLTDKVPAAPPSALKKVLGKKILVVIVGAEHHNGK